MTSLPAGALDMKSPDAIAIIATSAATTRAGGVFFLNSDALHLPCHDHAAAPGQPSDLSAPTTSTSAATTASAATEPNDLAAHGDCFDCSTCQVCHSVALSLVIHLFAVLALPTQAVQSGQTLFASVPRAPHLKPPIA